MDQAEFDAVHMAAQKLRPSPKLPGEAGLSAAIHSLVAMLTFIALQPTGLPTAIAAAVGLAAASGAAYYYSNQTWKPYFRAMGDDA